MVAVFKRINRFLNMIATGRDKGCRAVELLKLKQLVLAWVR